MSLINRLNTAIVYPQAQTNIAWVLDSEDASNKYYSLTWINNSNPEDFQPNNNGVWYQIIQKMSRISFDKYQWVDESIFDLTTTGITTTAVNYAINNYRLGILFQHNTNANYNQYYFGKTFQLPVEELTPSGITSMSLVDWTFGNFGGFYPRLTMTNPNYGIEGFTGEMISYIFDAYGYAYAGQETTFYLQEDEIQFDTAEWDKVSDYSRTITGVRMDVRTDYGIVATGETISIVLSSGNTIPQFDFNAPSGLTTTDITTTDMTFNWGMGSTDSTTATHNLRVYVSRNGGVSYDLGWDATTYSPITTVTSTMMKESGAIGEDYFEPDTEYFWKVWVSKAGLGWYSDAASFTTLAS